MARLAVRAAEIAPSATMTLIRRAAELKAEGRQVISLIAGEPDFDTPDETREAGIAAIRAGDLRYTAGDGTAALRAAIVAKLRRENGLEYDPAQTLVANGTKPLLHAAVLTLADPGDEVIVPAPYWTSYPDIVRLAGAVPVCPATTGAEGFLLTPEALEATISPRTRALLLNTPNNPTGAIYDAERLAALNAVLERHPQIAVITDEIYEHITYDGIRAISPAAAVAGAQDRTIVINGFSKGYVMMGWRLGFAAGPLPMIRGMSTMLSHLAGAPNSISQAAACAALDEDTGYMARNRAIYQERRDLAVSMINQMSGLSAQPTPGAFFVFADCTGTIGARTPSGETIGSDEDFARLAVDEAGVVIAPGRAFGLSPYLRLSYSTDSDELRTGLERLRQFCGSLT